MINDTANDCTTDCLAAGADHPCGDCNACVEHAYREACSGEETAALVGMAGNDDEQPVNEGDDERGYNPYSGGYDDDC